MNTLGEINSHCVNGNSADRLGLIKEALTLGQSLEEVSRVQAQQKLFVIKYADSDQEDVELDHGCGAKVAPHGGHRQCTPAVP